MVLLYQGVVPSSSLKSPWRINAVGTACGWVSEKRYRVHSSPTNQKNFCLSFSVNPTLGIQTGPPTTNPKSLKTNGAGNLVVALWLRVHGLAFMAELRRYSNNAP